MHAVMTRAPVTIICFWCLKFHLFNTV